MGLQLKLSAGIVTAFLALTAAAPSRPAPAQAGSRQRAPKLVVIIVVDQMRADYLTEYGTMLRGGLRRLIRDGAWFTNAAYPYLNTVTCAGHATIGTGTFPYRHGMILNAWLDRATGKSPYCTDDPDVQDISYNGLTPAQGDSARRLLAPTLAAQVRARGGRSVVLSLKPRSAVPIAGADADAVIWFDDRGGWSTSSAYARAPVPFIREFIEANPVSADFDKTWNRSLDPADYLYVDDGEGEGTSSGWARTFPHPLGVRGARPDGTFYSRWQRSPFADEYLARMAMASIDALKLGQGGTTDFLGVSFSSLDIVGHTFGPRSHEVQDMLVRLDRTIGLLLDRLDRRVGRDNYVLGLSADHGVAVIPEQAKAGGRQPGKVAADALTKALTPILGPGEHVTSTAYTDIYLSPAANQKLAEDPKLVALTMDTLASLPAVARVFKGSELATESARTSSDPQIRAAALSYYPGRSGDFILVPKEQWFFATSVTTHGTHYSYDQRVPLIVFGAGVQRGASDAVATPADLAPTLAAIAGVTIAPTDGRVLKEALGR